MTNIAIDSIFDSGSFVETNAYIISSVNSADRKAGDGCFTGYGAVNERLVFAAVQDDSFLGGAVGVSHFKKISNTVDMAAKMKAPFVLVLNSSGFRLEEGIEILAQATSLINSLSKAGEIIPLISIIRGEAYGILSTIASLCDHVFMVKDKSFMSMSTADIISVAQNKTVLPKDISSSDICSRAGSCSFNTASDEECFDLFKSLLTYLPDSVESGAPDDEEIDTNVDITLPDGIDDIASIDVRDIIRSISDHNKFIEINADYAPNMVTCLCRFGGRAVAVIANQPSVDNYEATSNACIKAASMISFADKFSIPVLTLSAIKGFKASDSEEKNAVASYSAMLAQAFACCCVPKLNIVIGKCYGSGYSVMNSKQLGCDYVYAWNSAEISLTSPELYALVAYKDEIASASDSVKARKDAIQSCRDSMCAPIVAAGAGYVDDIIDPYETRARIISAFNMMDRV